VLATVAVAAMWHSQGGGYGYRLLADLSVPMCLFIVPVLGAIGRGFVLPCAFGILAAISFFVHLAGAATFMTGPADVWKWNGGRLHCAFMTRPKLGDVFLDAQMERYDSVYTGMRSAADAANDILGGFLSALVPWPLPEEAIPYCRSEPIGIASRPHLPNVILISIDSLRADHLGCHGYGRDTSPSIDRIAAQSFRFASAVSQAPWTLPSHASILTGRNPISHGVDRTIRKLGPRTDTLPVWLKRKGYYTGGVVSGPYMHRSYGFDRGFHEYDDALSVVEDPHSIITSPGIHAKALDFLDRNGGRPFFLFLHYWDVHYDYNPPPPYDTYFDRTYTGSLDPSDFEHNTDINRDMSPRDLQYLVSLYDGEIRYVDDHIGMLVQELSRRRLLEETILVITSDHGDEFYEHGEKGHSHSVYGELVDVPLIIRLPGASGNGVIDRPVALIDIPPTILRLLGFKPDLKQVEGRSLLGMMRGDPKVREAPIWSETQRGRKVKETLPTGRPLRSLRLGQYKYLRYEAGDRGPAIEEYYDLAADPGERSPVPEPELKARGFPPLSDHMNAWLEYWRERHKGGEDAEVNPELMKALKKLGYAGS
jgi:arylsulfatase A-like enzyme